MARIDSRVDTMTIGRINKPRVKPAVRMLWPKPNMYTNKPSANRPYTIEGTPARLVTLISIRSENQFLGAYSSRYKPAATPIGTATKNVTSITSAEPTQADSKPALAARRDGNSLKNFKLKRSKPSITKSPNRINKVSSENISASKPMPAKI